MQFAIKVLVSALIIASVSEIGKRFTFFAAIVASLPLTSVLSILWLYRDTQDIQKIISLSTGIFWAVIPSLVFLIVLPMFLKMGVKFGVAMIFSALVTVFAYGIYILILNKFDIQI